MNEKITQPRLVARLSETAGVSKRMAEEFIKALISTVADEIENHNSIKIKGFGSFKVSKMEARKSVNVSTGEAVEIPPHYKVSFIPDKTVAAAVNAPFEIFETVELDDNVDEDELQLIGDEDYDLTQEMTEVTANSYREERGEEKSEELGEKLEEDFGIPEPVEPFGPVEPDDSKQEAEPLPVLVPPVVEAPQPVADPKPVEVPNPVEVPDVVPVEKNEKRRSFNKGLLVGIAASLIIMAGGLAVLYFLVMNKIDSLWARENQIAAVAKPQPATADSAAADSLPAVAKIPAEKEAEEEKQEAEVETPASDKPVYDTISTTRYLTTMAKEHYGNYHLWPYIYMENSKFLGHPDRIKPGTRVVIPDLAKYNVSASNPLDIKKAKELGVQIYRKYN